MTTSPLERAADSFAAELARQRTGRGLSKKQLAVLMGFDPSYVSHVEGRRHRPTEDFARRAEAVLEASGAIWQRFREYDDLRHARAGSAAPRAVPARTVAATRHRPRRGTGTGHPHPHRRRLPVRHPPGAVQRRHRAGHPLPGPGRRRPLPERPRPLQPAPPGAPAHLRRAATTGPPGRRRRRPGADALASQARSGRVQGDLAALRERGATLPALPGRPGHHRVRVQRRAREVGPLVPAGRPAAHPAARRTPGPARGPRPAGLGRGNLALARRRARCGRRRSGTTRATGRSTTGRPTTRR